MARIAMFTSEFAPFHGGIGSYARELAHAAVAAGHHVTMLSPDYGQNNAVADALLPFRVIRYPDNAPTMRTLFRRIVQTRRLLRREQFDIVHAVDWPFFIPLYLAPRNDARALLTVHGTEIIYMGELKRRWLLKATGFWRGEWASWIANSKYTADLLCTRFPQVPKNRVRAIPLGLSESWIAGRADRGTARAKLAVEDGRIVMVSLGRVVPRKGHGVVAAALGLLQPSIAARIDWWVIGPMLDTDHKASLELAAVQLAVRTTFFGSLPEEAVQLRLSAADLFCLPGYQDDGGRVEGFGLVFLEAGAYGVPAVATHSGGIPEAVEAGVTGLLVPEHDALATADAITQLVVNTSLREQMAAAACAKANAATWDQVMRRTYEE